MITTRAQERMGGETTGSPDKLFNYVLFCIFIVFYYTTLSTRTHCVYSGMGELIERHI